MPLARNTTDAPVAHLQFKRRWVPAAERDAGFIQSAKSCLLFTQLNSYCCYVSMWRRRLRL